MLTPSLEDYLEEIYRLSLSEPGVRISDIAERLGFSLPSVVKAVQRLRDKGLILSEPYGLITLTPDGKELGSFLVERNSLIQEFFTTIQSSYDVAAEAEAIEHYLSLPALDAIRSLVGFFRSKPDVLNAFLAYRRCTETEGT